MDIQVEAQKLLKSEKVREMERLLFTLQPQCPCEVCKKRTPEQNQAYKAAIVLKTVGDVLRDVNAQGYDNLQPQLMGGALMGPDAVKIVCMFLLEAKIEEVNVWFSGLQDRLEAVLGTRDFMEALLAGTSFEAVQAEQRADNRSGPACIRMRDNSYDIWQAVRPEEYKV